MKTKTKILIGIFILHALIISLFVFPGRPDGEGWAWIGPVAIDYPVVIFLYPLLNNVAPNSGTWLPYSGHVVLGGLYWVLIARFISWLVSFYRSIASRITPNKPLQPTQKPRG